MIFLPHRQTPSQCPRRKIRVGAASSPRVSHRDDHPRNLRWATALAGVANDAAADDLAPRVARRRRFRGAPAPVAHLRAVSEGAAHSRFLGPRVRRLQGDLRVRGLLPSDERRRGRRGHRRDPRSRRRRRRGRGRRRAPPPRRGALRAAPRGRRRGVLPRRGHRHGGLWPHERDHAVVDVQPGHDARGGGHRQGDLPDDVERLPPPRAQALRHALRGQPRRREHGLPRERLRRRGCRRRGGARLLPGGTRGGAHVRDATT